MTTVLFNQKLSDDERRTRLYDGQVLVYSASPESLALVEHARSMIAEAFGSIDPETAQFNMPVEDFAALLGRTEAEVHSPPRVQTTDQGAARVVRLRSRYDLLRRSPNAHVDVERLLDIGNLLCVSPAPGYLVFGTVQPTELVDPDLPSCSGERDGVPSAVLGQPGPERIAALQLLRMESEQPAVLPLSTLRPTLATSRSRRSRCS